MYAAIIQKLAHLSRENLVRLTQMSGRDGPACHVALHEATITRTRHDDRLTYFTLPMKRW